MRYCEFTSAPAITGINSEGAALVRQGYHDNCQKSGNSVADVIPINVAYARIRSEHE
jgi:hypothetical protein